MSTGTAFAPQRRKRRTERPVAAPPYRWLLQRQLVTLTPGQLAVIDAQTVYQGASAWRVRNVGEVARVLGERG